MGAAHPDAPPDLEGTIREAVDASAATVMDHHIFEANSVVAIRGDRVAELRREGDEPDFSGCDYRNAVFTNLGGWQESLDGCGIIGFDWTARYSYTWSRDTLAWNSGPSCVQGRGYSTSRSVSTPVWTNAGCGSSGSASAFIGNRATVAKIRGHVNAAGKIGYVRWR
ncbi:hypothetical protein [Herbiconiux sp. VKM Ac-2851]|uniref:hypothetical protein n=1 Tax=Herbiconiux sp. VKM Ac-2851 TaxID=2739025 RepID=UPI0015631C16|nr:hypothetical protein [Herbiconiux sp. VKM Ac-2851]NQX34652.1 hypothetical protein [Herbiconiux sp. VKM Ac-2851]